MSDKLFRGLLIAIVCIGVLATLSMVVYTAYLHGNCSIIGFLSSER